MVEGNEIQPYKKVYVKDLIKILSYLKEDSLVACLKVTGNLAVFDVAQDCDCPDYPCSHQIGWISMDFKDIEFESF